MDTSKKARRSAAAGDNSVSQMLASALRVAEVSDGAACCYDPQELSLRIETTLFEVHRGIGEKYKTALRSRVFNLRDKKNPALRENLMTGAVTAEKFAVMTAQEMASDDMKKTREKFSRESIEEHKMWINEGTTYVFCRDCGNRWKFN